MALLVNRWAHLLFLGNRKIFIYVSNEDLALEDLPVGGAGQQRREVLTG